MGIKLLPWVYESVTQCDVCFSKIHPLNSVARNHMPMSDLVSCSFSTISLCSLLIHRIFHLLVSTPFLLAFSKLICILHIMNAFLDLLCIQYRHNTLSLGQANSGQDDKPYTWLLWHSHTLYCFTEGVWLRQTDLSSHTYQLCMHKWHHSSML